MTSYSDPVKWKINKTPLHLTPLNLIHLSMQIVCARRVQRTTTFTLRTNCTQRIRKTFESIANGRINERLVESMQSLFRGKWIFISVYIILLLSGTKQNKRERDSSADIFVRCQCVCVSVSPSIWGRHSVRVCIVTNANTFVTHITWFTKIANDIHREKKKTPNSQFFFIRKNAWNPIFKYIYVDVFFLFCKINF